MDFIFLQFTLYYKNISRSAPGGSVVKNLPANAGNMVGSLIRKIILIQNIVITFLPKLHNFLK